MKIKVEATPIETAIKIFDNKENCLAAIRENSAKDFSDFIQYSPEKRDIYKVIIYHWPKRSRTQTTQRNFRGLTPAAMRSFGPLGAGFCL